MCLEHSQGRLDDPSGVLSFRLGVCLKDVQVIFIEEGVAGADCERKADEEEVDVDEEHRLPDRVGLAFCLLIWSKLEELIRQVIQANATVDDAENTEAVEDQ